MLNMFKAIPAFIQDEEGQDIIEYGLLAAFIAIVVAAILMEFSTPLAKIYQTVLDALKSASDSVPVQPT